MVAPPPSSSSGSKYKDFLVNELAIFGRVLSTFPKAFLRLIERVFHSCFATASVEARHRPSEPNCDRDALSAALACVIKSVRGVSEGC